MQLSLFNNSQKKRKYVRKKRVGYVPSKGQIQRLLVVKQLYDRHKTLDGVAKQLNLTRERVRQLLKKGQEYHLFKYELTREKNIKYLVGKVSKDEFVKAIKINPRIYAVCLELNIDIRTYYKLSKYYQICISDYVGDVRQKKHLLLYSNIVKVLGHHPSTTEMNRNPSWRYTWIAINRMWGGIKNFRSEYGIDRPKFSIHPNTASAFRKAKEKASQRKHERIQQVKSLIEFCGPISTKDISKNLGFRAATTYTYVRYLLDENLIKMVGSVTTAKYSSLK